MGVQRHPLSSTWLPALSRRLISAVEFEEELYAERVRRQAQAEDLAAGRTDWTEDLSGQAKVKLHLAWLDVTEHIAFRDWADQMERLIDHWALRSVAASLSPMDMRGNQRSSGHLLSLIEAEHKALAVVADERHELPMPPDFDEWIAEAPERFRRDVNRIFEAHIIAFRLHQNSVLVPIRSQEMHSAVVEPTLYLLHSQPEFAGAEAAYQDALSQIRRREPGTAIIHAGTALQEVLTGLGCDGKVLGDLLKSARLKGLVKGEDTSLTESVRRTVDWVASWRNQDSKAHKGKPDVDMPDAWMVVHVVGALIIRLSESKAQDSESPS